MATRNLTISVLILGLVWGLNFSLMKFAALSGIPFALLATMTIFGNLVIFTGFCLLFTGRLRLARTAVVFFLACGILGYLLPFFMELFAAPRIGASTLALLVALTPIMTLLIAGLSRTERITLGRTVGILLGFLAILPIVLRDPITLNTALDAGLLVGLGVPLVYAIYHTVIARFWPPDLHDFEVALGETAAATVLMIPIYLLSTTSSDIPEEITWSSYWIVGALLAFSALEVWLYFRIMRVGGAVYVSQSGYIAVIAGIFWGAVFFAENISWWLLMSLLMILIALWFVAPAKKEEEG